MVMIVFGVHWLIVAAYDFGYARAKGPGNDLPTTGIVIAILGSLFILGGVYFGRRTVSTRVVPFRV